MSQIQAMPYIKDRSLAPTQKIEILLFQSGSEIFATRTSDVERLWHGELIRVAPDETLSPRLTNAFLGWIKGNSVPVFDLCQLLGFGMPASFSGAMIVFPLGTRSVGVAVEKIFEVRTFNISQIELLPPFIEEQLKYPTAWALLRLDEPVSLQTDTVEVYEAGSLVVLLNFAGLFDQQDQQAIF